MHARKLRLRLDEVEVESFQTGPAGPFAGTVWGRQSEDPPFNTVGDLPTCEPCDDPPFNTVGAIATCEPCEASNQATCDTCVGPNCKEVGVA